VVLEHAGIDCPHGLKIDAKPRNVQVLLVGRGVDVKAYDARLAGEAKPLFLSVGNMQPLLLGKLLARGVPGLAMKKRLRAFGVRLGQSLQHREGFHGIATERLQAAGLDRHDFRESWLRAAAAELRPYFASVGYPLPDNIRFAIAFTSTGRKGKRVGECWHSSTSDDNSYEIFLRADIAEPVEVLGVLVKELVHTALPADTGHGKQFKQAAIKIGLQGPMRKAQPGVLLQNRLIEVAAALGPLPHASLHIDQTPLTAVAVALDRPKKQRTRMLKAECPECAKEDRPYNVRIAASTAREIGAPHCPKHGAMTVEFPPETEDEAESETEARESV
jgi:hypothetical protein